MVSLVFVLLAALLPASLPPAGQSAESSPDQTVSGTVLGPDGGPLDAVMVDLFATRPGSSERAEFMSSASTTGDGRFTFDTGQGCFVVEVRAPAAAAFSAGSPTWRQPVCSRAGHQERPLAAQLSARAATVSIGGLVSHRSDPAAPTPAAPRPAPTVTVELYEATGDGGPGRYLGAGRTDGDGRFRLPADPGCVVVVIVAPDGDAFADSRRLHNHAVCPTPGQATPAITATLASVAPVAPSLGPVELELVRLTNELRADPAGPLARRKPLPPCASDEFFAITVDARTGHPVPAPALTIDGTVAVNMARAWALAMAHSGHFEHRTSPAQQQLLTELGRPAAAWGENIAWFTGYDPALSARIHFEGWRESDSGHYCSLVTERFTHVGVGAVSRHGQSWAVQNFYG